MWVKFTDRFDWRPKPRVIIAYKPGMKVSVTKNCADAAVAAGKAEILETPTREQRDFVEDKGAQVAAPKRKRPSKAKQPDGLKTAKSWQGPSSKSEA